MLATIRHLQSPPTTSQIWRIEYGLKYQQQLSLPPQHINTLLVWLPQRTASQFVFSYTTKKKKAASMTATKAPYARAVCYLWSNVRSHFHTMLLRTSWLFFVSTAFRGLSSRFWDLYKYHHLFVNKPKTMSYTAYQVMVTHRTVKNIVPLLVQNKTMQLPPRSTKHKTFLGWSSKYPNTPCLLYTSDAADE